MKEHELLEAKAADAVNFTGALIGVLIGFRDDARAPLVIFKGQLSQTAVSARSTVDLQGSHVGREVALIFESADPRRPIVVGCLQRAVGWPDSASPHQVQVDADGERMSIAAKEQLVLRCGRASITLTRSGKVIIDGAYVSTRSSGVIRIKGGAVQIN